VALPSINYYVSLIAYAKRAGLSRASQDEQDMQVRIDDIVRRASLTVCSRRDINSMSAGLAPGDWALPAKSHISEAGTVTWSGRIF
jgi:hypothetical protein